MFDCILLILVVSGCHFRFVSTQTHLGLLSFSFRKKSEFSIRVVSWMCIRMGVRLQSNVQRTGTWLTATWPSRLWYRPVVFFRHLRRTAFSFPQEKNSALFQKCYFIFILLFRNYVSLKLRCVTFHSLVCVRIILLYMMIKRNFQK